MRHLRAAMTRIVLKLSCPTCGRRTIHLPEVSCEATEFYKRTCVKCGLRWYIKMQPVATAPRPGVVATHIITWSQA